MLINETGVFMANAPVVSVKSTIGCGDTMVASVAESLHANRSPEEMLSHAVALAAANAMTLETAHILLSDYHALLPKISVEKLA